VTVVDWRTNTDRSAEINMQPGSRAGTITLRNAAGRPAWISGGSYIAVSV
jgi:hypothetical protein